MGLRLSIAKVKTRVKAASFLVENDKLFPSLAVHLALSTRIFS